MSKKILIVEDDKEIAELIKTRLESAGYQAACIDDGHQAVQFIKNQIPDLIILDIMLPEVDGYSFLRQLKRHCQEKNIATTPPVIVLTAKSQMQQLFEAEGVCEYLIKPFKGKELLEKVNLHLGEG